MNAYKISYNYRSGESKVSERIVGHADSPEEAMKDFLIDNYIGKENADGYLVPASFSITDGKVGFIEGESPVSSATSAWALNGEDLFENFYVSAALSPAEILAEELTHRPDVLTLAIDLMLADTDKYAEILAILRG